jgi:hypothetical protein
MGYEIELLDRVVIARALGYVSPRECLAMAHDATRQVIENGPAAVLTDAVNANIDYCSSTGMLAADNMWRTAAASLIAHALVHGPEQQAMAETWEQSHQSRGITAKSFSTRAEAVVWLDDQAFNRKARLFESIRL